MFLNVFILFVLFIFKLQDHSWWCAFVRCNKAVVAASMNCSGTDQHNWLLYKNQSFLDLKLCFRHVLFSDCLIQYLFHVFVSPTLVAVLISMHRFDWLSSTTWRDSQYIHIGVWVLGHSCPKGWKCCTNKNQNNHWKYNNLETRLTINAVSAGCVTRLVRVNLLTSLLT